MTLKINADKYLVFLTVFTIAFIIFTNVRINQTQGWDESRHAVQGHLFYDYFKTLLSGDLMSFRTFMQQYQEKGYNAGWFLIDPPFHAIIQGITFLFFGADPVTAAIATEIFIVIGAFLLYLLSLKILHKKHLALCVVMLYLLCPFLTNIGGLSMLEIPISLMMVGWYYFTFHRERKNFSLKISEKVKLTIGTNIFWGALFLAAATLMKYQSLLYAGAFYAIYIIYRLIKEKKFALSMFKDGIWQGAIVLLISAWWIKFSLFDYGFLKRLTELSLTYQEPQWSSLSYTFSYFIDTFKETSSIAFFAFIPLLIWFKKRKESFLSENKKLFIFILSVYLVATVLITSRHFRYAIHLLPFMYIFIVKGIEDVSFFLKNKIRINKNFALTVIIIVLVVFSGFVTFKLMQEQVKHRGVYSYELVDYLAQIPNPKFLVNVDADLEGGTSRFNDGTAYYYNQDLFIFEAMMTNDRINAHNPKLMTQQAQIIPVRGMQDYTSLTQSLGQTGTQVKTVVVLFKRYNQKLFSFEIFEKQLLEQGFNKKELTWYYVYEKGK